MFDDDALDACLADAEAHFDARGKVPSVDAKVDGGQLKLAFSSVYGFDALDACLASALAEVTVEPVSVLGGLAIERVRPATPVDAVVTKLDGLHARATATPQGERGVTVSATAVPSTDRAFGEQALVLSAARYRPDKTSTHVASWTVPPGPTVCVPAGSAHELTATLAASDRPGAGEVARVTVWLQSGPCGSEADADRIAIAGVQVGDDGVTLWRPAALDSLPDPFSGGPE